MQPLRADDPISSVRLYLGLIHHPVVDSRGAVIASAFTNLDLHDICRAAKTYGVRAVFCVTPLKDQQALIRNLARHWTAGYGARHNPDRCAAMQLLQIKDSLDAAIAAVASAEGSRPLTVATSARRQADSIDFGTLRRKLAGGSPHLLMFGTAWGLAPEAIAASDAVLEPVEGTGAYNHLSVRSAAAIILDRLLADGRGG